MGLRKPLQRSRHSGRLGLLSLSKQPQPDPESYDRSPKRIRSFTQENAVIDGEDRVTNLSSVGLRQQGVRFARRSSYPVTLI